MDKRIKILVIVVITLGALSGIFLLTSKKKPAVTQPVKTVAPAQANNVATPVVKTPIVKPSDQTAPAAKVAVKTPEQIQAAAEARKKLIREQWTQCKAKTFSQTTNLFWNIQISEAIPTGGTYAKGNLDNDSAYPVRVTIKAGATDPDKIKARLAVGKAVFVRGNCAEVATDGAVIIEAF